MHPKTKYAKSGGASIAYQIVGDGPFDLIFVPGFASHVEAIWDFSGPEGRGMVAEFVAVEATPSEDGN